MYFNIFFRIVIQLQKPVNNEL